MADPRLNLIFMGTPDFAVPTLEAIIKSRHRVSLVISRPDRGRGRGRKLMPTPVKSAAMARGITVVQPVNIRAPEFESLLHEHNPNLIVVAAYGRILPQNILDLPSLGTINVHGSLLPRYRGAAPIQRAIINGDTITGITIMEMDAGMDTGAILLQEKIAITAEDTSGSLFARMADLGGRLLVRALDLMAAGDLSPVIQDDALATPAPPLTKREAIPDWRRPAAELSCLIRGLDPWPLVKGELDGEQIRLFSPRVIEGTSAAAPGTVVRADDGGVMIACGRDFLLIRELQRPGSRRLSAADFLRGRKIEAGRRFKCGA